MGQMAKKDAPIKRSPVLTRTFLSRPSELKAVRKDVTETARKIGCGAVDVQDLVLAVDEACQNIICHAYGEDHEGEISLKFFYQESEIVVMLRDFAEAIDAEMVKPRKLGDLRPGGRGTHFIAEIMDKVEFMPPPTDGGNLLRMVKRIS